MRQAHVPGRQGWQPAHKPGHGARATSSLGKGTHSSLFCVLNPSQAFSGGCNEQGAGALRYDCHSSQKHIRE